MADDKKYYYMRLKEDFFDNNDAVKIMESMADGYLYSNILLKLYLKSLKCNGRLMYNDRIPYNADVLATLTGHNVGVVEKALKVFEGLGLIEVLDNGAIYMLDIQNYIGKSSTEADRKRAYRNRIENEKLLLSGQTSGQMSGQNSPEIEIEKEIDIDIEKDIEAATDKNHTSINYQQIADMYNDTCVSFPRVNVLSDSRKKAIKARLKKYTLDDFKTLFEKAEASSFLKGANNRDWSASFDWLIKDSNMAKVLEGNYDDKNGKRKEPTPDWMNKKQNSFNNFPQRECDYDALQRALVEKTQQTYGNSDLKERAEKLKESLGVKEDNK